MRAYPHAHNLAECAIVLRSYGLLTKELTAGCTQNNRPAEAPNAVTTLSSAADPAGVDLSLANIDSSNARDITNTATNPLLLQPCFDSREVSPGSLFYCKGTHFEPHFLDQAIARGARAYVSEQHYFRTVGNTSTDAYANTSTDTLTTTNCAGANNGSVNNMPIPGLLVSDIRQAMAHLNALFYAGLTEQLHITGITGTKGKSTVAYFLRSIFDTWAQAIGRAPSAILSSIDNYDGVSFEESHMTTQENLELYRHFANAVESGCEQLTMEVTSQALKYHRTLGIGFDVACFTNFGLDHISAIEHKDAEDYLAAKLRIFSQCRVAVINLESAEQARIWQAAQEGSAELLLSFGLSDQADFWASDIVGAANGLRFTLHLSEKAQNLVSQSVSGSASKRICDRISEYPITISLTGRFNVQNALAAIACSFAAGTPLSAIQEGLQKARVPGRMELFKAAKDKTIIVDYAHNLMSFEALFASVRRDYPNAALTAVFGCPGYKAYSRRRDLAEVCARYYADVILTEEDSGEEPTLKICNDIARHLQEAGGKDAQIIENRECAIQAAIDQAPAGGVILFTGKGRETRQKRGLEYIPVLSDVEMVERYLRKSTDNAL